MLILPFGFKTVAQQTIPSFFVIAFLCKKAPVNWHFTRIREYTAHHAPYQQYENDMEHCQHDKFSRRISLNAIFENEDEIIKADKYDNTKEVRVEELGEFL
jgi:hypothetical protein